LSKRFTNETFFRPRELLRQRLNLPASLFNRCRLLVTRSETYYRFIPIRSMQYQAVIDREEIIFVDHQGGYAVQDGEGGRLIVLAWQFPPALIRESLHGPVGIDLVLYRQDAREIHRRIMSEFPPALDRFDERQLNGSGDSAKGHIVPFKPIS
jgi:hypothetical protein